MTRSLIGCILANLACIAACAGLMAFYPKASGFTITTPSSTHFLSGGVFLSTALLCLLDLAIGIYLAWSLLNPR